MAAQNQFHRIHITQMCLTRRPARARDILRLVRHFVQRSRAGEPTIESIPSDAMEVLLNYSWPGNIRELQNVIERAVILSPGPELRISASELRAMPSGRESYDGMANGSDRPSAKAKTLDEADRDLILNALGESHWVLGGPSGAAARLAMKRTTLQSKLKKLGTRGLARPPVPYHRHKCRSFGTHHFVSHPLCLVVHTAWRRNVR